jgi:hypothetical protein
MSHSFRSFAIRLTLILAGVAFFRCSSSSTPAGTGESVALMGTAAVTKGSTAVTFAVAQSLADGTELQFSSQAGVLYTLAKAITDAKTGTLTAAYDGASSTTATVLTTAPSTLSDAGLDAAYCYPDNDGINGGAYTFDLVVNDTGFFATGPDAGTKELLSTQNDAQVTLTLTNNGTKPHGFKVGCTTATAPAGCSTTVCFPANAAIAPLAPGESKTITFDTPTPDGIIYPFTSNEPADSTVDALNDGQWSLM